MRVDATGDWKTPWGDHPMPKGCEPLGVIVYGPDADVAALFLHQDKSYQIFAGAGGVYFPINPDDTREILRQLARLPSYLER